MSILLRRHNLMAANDSPAPETPTPIHDYPNEYLTTEALGNGTITFSIPANVPIETKGGMFGGNQYTGYVKYVEYSTNGGTTWTKINNIADSEVNISVPVTKGDCILWRAKAYQYCYYANSTSYTSRFSSTCNYKVYGNIMSMLYVDDFVDKDVFPQRSTANQRQFYGFFYDSSNLLEASNLILPVSSLKANCYGSMFRGCTSLTIAPDLLATTLAANCYNYMFYDCTSLCSIKMKATTAISNNSYTNNWVYNVSNSGTFYKKRGVSIPTGVYGIPSGWTVVEED